MGDRAQNFGHAVEAGEVRYFSPSSLTAADPNQYGGCLRRWFFKYVLGKKEPFTASQKKGVEVHDQIERYLKTGDKLLGSIAMAGARFIPAPGPTNQVEFSMVETERVGELDIIRKAPLTAAGKPVVGFGDLLIRNAETWINEEGEHRPNRPNTVEPIDWKTTSKLDNAKPAAALVETIQMPGYGEWAARTNGTPIDWVRLSHVTFQTTGRATAIKRSALVSREEVARRWELAEGVARSCIDAARETDAAKVPGNKRACGAYRGCPHADYCPIASESSLDDLLGVTASKEITMSLTGKLSLLANATPAPAPSVSLDLKAQIAALKEEEARAHAAASAPAPMPAVAQAPVPAGFIEALATIERAGMGFPAMTPVLAQVYAAAKGMKIEAGAPIQGSGTLGQLTLIDPAQVLQLAAEVGPMPAPVKVEPAAVGILPSDAPASNPLLAAKPLDTGAAQAVASATGPTPLDVELAEENAEMKGEAPKKRKPGRPKKSEPKEVQMGDTTTDADFETEETEIYVNALPRFGTSFKDLSPYIAALNASLSADYQAADVRCAPKGTPLEFGGWKGVVAGVARLKPPAPGTYVLLVRTELDQIVADALADFVVSTGVKP